MEAVRATPHVLIGVSEGCAYQASGEPVGNVLWTDNTSRCVISIKRDEGEYENAWHALFVYAPQELPGRLDSRSSENEVERVFEFEIDG